MGWSSQVTIANKLIIEGSGGEELVYSGAAAAGNLIGSRTAVAGTDQYGNKYLAGDTEYGSGFAVQISAGSLNYYIGSLATGWTFIGNIDGGVTLGGKNALIVAGTRIFMLGGSGANAFAYLFPSFDTLGVQDTANLKALLGAGYSVQLIGGQYYIDSAIEFPQGTVIRGAGRSGLGLTNVQTTITATAAMDAMLCSAGWLEGSNTTAQETVTFADFKLYGAGLATHGIASQNYDSLFANLEIEDVTGDGLRFDSYDQAGAVHITTTGVNNRVTGCTFQDCGRGFATNEASSGAAVFTDGFIENCIVANASGTGGIAVQRCAGWKITGNHLYGLAKHGIQAGQMYATVIDGNYIETWGTTASSGIYRAVDGASIGQSDDGPGSVISGNRIDMYAAPGNAATNLEGISVLCDASNSANFAVVGNAVYCGPSTGWATAHAFEYANAASTSTLTIASTGNIITGHWSGTIVQVPNGGTITLNAGS